MYFSNLQCYVFTLTSVHTYILVDFLRNTLLGVEIMLCQLDYFVHSLLYIFLPHFSKTFHLEFEHAIL